MRWTKTTIGTSRMPSLEPAPRSSRSASVKTACLAIQVLPVPGPAREDRLRRVAAVDAVGRRMGEAHEVEHVVTFHPAGIARLSCVGRVEMWSVWSLMRRLLPVIASSTCASRTTMSSK